jgi:hypothetical protein
VSRAAVEACAGLVQWHMSLPATGLHHVPLAELAGRDVETELVRHATAGGRVLLVGPRGAGKTSLVAGALGPLADLPDGLAIIHVSVLMADARTLTEPLGFCVYLLQQVEQWAAPIDVLSAQDLARLRAATVAETVTERGAGALRVDAGVPLGVVNPQLGFELAGRVRQLHRQLNPARLNAAVDAMLRAFAERGLAPFFTFDDADQWTARGHESATDRVAEAFFGRVVQWLARSANVGFLVAVRDDYRHLPGYREARDVMDELPVPRLANPAEAIARIVDRQLELAGVAHRHVDLYTAAALDRLGARYSETSDIRSTLKLAAYAVNVALEVAADVVDRREVEAAARQAAGE